MQWFPRHWMPGKGRQWPLTGAKQIRQALWWLRITSVSEYPGCRIRAAPAASLRCGNELWTGQISTKFTKHCRRENCTGRDKATYDLPPGVPSRTDHHAWKTKEMEKDRQREGGGRRKRKRRKKFKQRHLVPKGLESRVPCTQRIRKQSALHTKQQGVVPASTNERSSQLVGLWEC